MPEPELVADHPVPLPVVLVVDGQVRVHFAGIVISRVAASAGPRTVVFGEVLLEVLGIVVQRSGHTDTGLTAVDLARWEGLERVAPLEEWVLA